MVISVSDGDTITVLTPEKKQVRVRLTEIDAPEKGQPYSEKSKQALSALVFGKNVVIDPKGTDKYGRLLGRVFVGDADVNLCLIEQGAAWAYNAYLTDPSIKKAEQAAQKSKSGLWALHEKQIVPPWEWRKSIHKQENVVTKEVKTGELFSCGYKNRCKQMISCSEARFYLRNCGAKSLDGDGDGVPCESICRER